MPEPPYLYRLLTLKSFDLTKLGEKIHGLEKDKLQYFEASNSLQSRVVQVRNEMEIDNTPATAKSINDLEAEILRVLGDTSKRRERESNMSGIVEDFVRLKAFHHFIATGNLLPKSSCEAYALDEEYLAGACMGMCQDLARYGMGRAIVRDEKSIREARDLVNDLVQYLLDYDFNNGYLKRRFDDVKYSLKTLETIMYEVNITADAEIAPLKKRAKLESRVAIKELEDVYDRIDARETLRDELGNHCKAVKKNARQAIFSCQREDTDRALKYLTRCEDIIRKEVYPIVNKEPPLKAGTFNYTMEEYIEAKLYHSWIIGKDISDDMSSDSVMEPQEFDMLVGPEPYLMGLCNLTGQIARHALARRTARDFKGVKQCLETCASINHAILTLERCPARIGQRFEQLKRIVGKLERMIYEMTLSYASGGKKIMSEAPFITPDSMVPRLPNMPGSAAFTGVSLVAASSEAVPDARLVKTQMVQNMGVLMDSKLMTEGVKPLGGQDSSVSSGSSNEKELATTDLSVQVKTSDGSVVQTVPVSLTVKTSSSSRKKGSSDKDVPVVSMTLNDDSSREKK